MSNTLPEPVSMGLRSIIPGIVRTLVPVVVALVVRIGMADILDDRTVEVVLTVLITMAYYAVVRFLETYWDKIGWLLGYPKQPVYVQGQVLAVQDVPTPPTTTTEVVTDKTPDTATPGHDLDDPLL